MENTFIVSMGCMTDVESAQARPPAKAAFKTLPDGISTGGGTATTVAASNHILLYHNNSIPIRQVYKYSIYIFQFSVLTGQNVQNFQPISYDVYANNVW
jgi:hypothetical protein